MEIKSLKTVHQTELFDDLAFIEEVVDSGEFSVTWGDADYTLISKDQYKSEINSNLEFENMGHPQVVELFRRIDNLPKDVLIAL